MRYRLPLVLSAVAGLLYLNVATAQGTADPLWARQYGPVQIGAPAAWQKSVGKGIKVSVVDSGVDVDHPDLKANLNRADSYDFACNDANPDDDSILQDGEGKAVKGHGTHVTGTIGAVANNNIGVAGVAPGVSVMVMKIFGTDDSCGGLVNLLAMNNAISRSVQRGAKVINLSVSDFTTGNDLVSTIANGCESAFSNGSLCVVSAGNSGEAKGSGFNFDFNGMIVTANDSTGAHAQFGQKADTKWGVSAPGVDVLNTWPIDDPNHDGYNAIQGTSMAAPHVAGAAAVLFGMGMNNRQVAETLVRTAGPPRNSLIEGAGIIRLDRAAGIEPAATTIKTNTPGQSVGAGTRSGRAGTGGGSQALEPTTTVPQGLAGVSGETDFEDGLTTNGDSTEELRLREASENSANQPFNVAGPLVGISVIATAIAVAFAIPRLRSKDTPPLS
ncbi:MAG: S8 family serine peptidase [Acidimicrobiales bacterium]|nr:S8 family serine peptidase [Acidimicrobiales bacterium]